MKEKAYRYALNLFKEDATHLGHVAVEADLEPALEWSNFWGIRQGRLPPVMSSTLNSVEPVWNSKFGQPYVEGLRCVFKGEQGTETLSIEIPLTYFAELAQQASTHFLKNGLLKTGERYYYSVSAFPSKPRSPAEPDSPNGFSVRELEKPIPLESRSLQKMEERASLVGVAHEADMPVFIPQDVLNEILILADGESANEIGGVFVGKLYRDTDSPEVMAVITAQVSAKHIHSQLHRVTFTAQTWTAVKAAIDLRGNDELMLGWWHSHNFMRETCKDCPISKDERKCASPIFMSADDVLFHRTVFPRAWGSALVIGENPCTGLDYALYGWRYGMVQPRAFYVLDANTPGAKLKTRPASRGDPKNGK
jgi:hypothetical protein